jgi:hypothetical protein
MKALGNGAGGDHMNPKEQREAVGKRVNTLFTAQEMTLGAMLKAAEALREEPGIAAFMISVPWKLTLPNGHTTLGNSYNLSSAADDIYAQLMFLSETHTSDALLTLALDPTRYTDAVKDADTSKKIGR